MTGRAVTRTKDRGRLHKTGDPSLLRMMALEYIKTFDEEAVAEAFDTTIHVVRRVMARDDIRDYIGARLIPIETLATVGARRLLEDTLKTAFDPDVDWRERMESRKILAKTLLPEFKKVTVEHNHYIRAPAKIESVEDWSRQFQPSSPVIDVEPEFDDE